MRVFNLFFFLLQGIDVAAKALVEYILEHDDKRTVEEDPDVIKKLSNDPAPQGAAKDDGCGC